VACSYDDVNDFALILQRSPLLQSTSVQIESAQQQGELLDPTTDGTCPGTPAGEPSFLVDYTIAANITDTPASELIDELERQGNVGLVTRLRALRETGVIE
jgi:type IV pilus assembly protein PilN